MFERTKLSLVFWVVLFGVASWALGHFHVADSTGKMVTITEAYSYYYDIVIGIGIAMVLATSLNLVNGHTGQFSLGHAGFMGLGAYFASMVSLGVQFPLVPYPAFAETPAWLIALKSIGWALAFAVNSLLSLLNVWVAAAHELPQPAQFVGALLVGGLAAALAGFLVGVPSLRLKGDYLAIVTLGFNEIIRVVIQNAEPLGAQRGLGGMPMLTNVFWTFSAAALTIYVVHNLVNSTYGRGFLAVRDDEIAAEAMGINTTKYKVLAFVTAAFFAGIAGGLYAHFKQFITPDGFGFMKSVDIVVMVILGGMGSTIGVCIAAVLLTILPELLRYVSHDRAGPTSPHAAFFIILLIAAIGAVCGVCLARVSIKRVRVSSRVRLIVSFVAGLAFALIATVLWNKYSGRIVGGLRPLAENRMIPYSLLLIVLMLMRPQGLFVGWGRKGPGK